MHSDQFGNPGYKIEKSSRPAARDYQISGLFALIFAIFYGWLAVQLADSEYGAVDNLAFDFDPRLYLCTFADSPMAIGGVKHPLILLLRPLTQALILLGVPHAAAAGLLMAAIGALGVGMWYLYLRAIAVTPAIAVAFTLLFAVSATQLYVAMIPDSYGPAGTALVGLWLLTSLRLNDPRAGGAWRYVAGFANFGITVTNVVVSFIAELLIWLRHETIGVAIRRTFMFGVWLAMLLALPLLAIWHAALWDILRDPVGWLKSVYWLQTFSEKAGLGPIFLTFVEFVTVAPDYVWVPIDDGWNMRDFRAPLYSTTGIAAAALWSALLAGGIAAGLRDRGIRWLTVGLLVTFAFNVALHTKFQFRLSLFIYTSHVLMLVFALAAGWARLASRHAASAWAMTVALAVLVCLTGANNIPMAVAFAQDFRNTGIKARVTCADYAAGTVPVDGQAAPPRAKP